MTLSMAAYLGAQTELALIKLRRIIWSLKNLKSRTSNRKRFCLPVVKVVSRKDDLRRKPVSKPTPAAPAAPKQSPIQALSLSKVAQLQWRNGNFCA